MLNRLTASPSIFDVLKASAMLCSVIFSISNCWSSDDLEKVRVKLDYIFSGEASDLEVSVPNSASLESQPSLETSSGNQESVIRTGPSGGSSEKPSDAAFETESARSTSSSEPIDNRLDLESETSIPLDRLDWQNTRAETLVDTQIHEASVTQRTSGVAFDEGYIPEFDEELKLEDSAPRSVERVYSHHDGRFPRSWVVPPGGGEPHPVRGGASELSAYPSSVGGYEYAGSDLSGRNGYYRGSRSSYPDSRYGGWRSRDYHHPEGPYGYEFEVDDPFWDVPPNYYGDAGYRFDPTWNLFSRFDPEQAHLKAGPFFLQVVSIEAGALYSDYNGPIAFRPGEEDGWLGYTSLRLRAAARITPKFYFVLDGELIYVFGGGGFGIRSRAGIGAPFLSFEYITQWGMWDVRIYDKLGSAVPFSLESGDDSFRRAGRYTFGFQGSRRRRDSQVFDPIIYNIIGIQATRLTSPTWRLTVEADHADFFFLDSDRGEKHRSRQHIGVMYSSVPELVKFNPYVRYDAYTVSNSDRWQHTFHVGGSEQVSDSLFVSARTGYFWQTGDNNSDGHWLWDVGLRHRISNRTSHGVRVGQNFFENEFTDDSVVASYVRYDLTHRFTERARFYGFAQWSDHEVVTGRVIGGEEDSEIYGVRLTYTVSRNVRASLGYRFQEVVNTATGIERDRSLFDARIDARLARQMTGYLLYQFEEDNFFDEDLYMAGVRRYF